jgi:ribosomal protein L31E
VCKRANRAKKMMITIEEAVRKRMKNEYRVKISISW